MIPQRFRVHVLERFTSSATYSVLPERQLRIDHVADAAPDLSTEDISSATVASAPFLALVDTEADGNTDGDNGIKMAARQRLASLRGQAEEVLRYDDGCPYEWTHAGHTETIRTLQSMHRRQRRLIHGENGS